jgi:hypothetical protein
MQLTLSFETTVAEMKLQFKNKKNGWVVNSVFHNRFSGAISIR